MNLTIAAIPPEIAPITDLGAAIIVMKYAHAIRVAMIAIAIITMDMAPVAVRAIRVPAIGVAIFRITNALDVVAAAAMRITKTARATALAIVAGYLIQIIHARIVKLHARNLATARVERVAGQVIAIHAKSNRVPCIAIHIALAPK
jgi:hypothetical protein